MESHSRRRRLVRTARTVISAMVVVGFSLGCMSFSYQRSPSGGATIDSSGTLRQEGEAPLIPTADNRMQVYYPRPFAANPNLKLAVGSGSVRMRDVQLIAQHPDHFVVSWSGRGTDASLKWSAEGMAGPVVAGGTASPGPMTNIPHSPTGASAIPGASGFAGFAEESKGGR